MTRNDHDHATAKRPERWRIWVCQNLSCMEWGPADETPRAGCANGHRFYRIVSLVAQSDAEQIIRERTR